MGARAKREDGNAAEIRVDKILHRLVRPAAEAKAHDDEIGGAQGLRARQAARVGRMDGAIRIEREEHGGGESVSLREDGGQHRHGFLGPVFLIAAEEDHLPAATGPVGGLKHQSVVLTKDRHDGEHRRGGARNGPAAPDNPRHGGGLRRGGHGAAAGSNSGRRWRSPMFAATRAPIASR